MSGFPQNTSDAKHIARWGSLGLEVALLVGFAILFEGTVRLAVLSLLGVVFLANSVFLFWTWGPRRVFVVDALTALGKHFSGRYVGTVIKDPTTIGGVTYRPVVALRPPDHRNVVMNRQDPLAAMPDAACVIRKSWRFKKYPCGPAMHNGLGLIVAQYPKALTHTVPDIAWPVPVPGKHVARWTSAVHNGRLPRVVMRWSDNGFRYHPVRRALSRAQRTVQHYKGIEV